MKPAVTREVKYYVEDSGDIPVAEWLESLLPNRKNEYAKVVKQIDKAGLGNFGDHRFIAGSLGELKIDYGQGYRVYFGIDGDEIILLLHGGTKKGQQQDIDLAKERWERYLQKKEKLNGKGKQNQK